MPPANSEGETRLHKILDGIQSVPNVSRLVTGHWSSSMVSTDEPAFAGAITLNAAYARPAPYAVTLRGYSYARAMPSFLIEAVFEAGSSPPEQGDPASVRGYEYGAYLLVDEAHSLGTYGSNGLGCAEAQGVLRQVGTVMQMYASENKGAILGNAWTSGASGVVCVAVRTSSA